MAAAQANGTTVEGTVGHIPLGQDGRTRSFRDPYELVQVAVFWGLRNWALLSVGVVVGVLSGWLVAVSQPATYVAEALIAPTRTHTEVQFESSIKTVTDAGGATGTGNNGLAPATRERMQALADLVRSSTVEAKVLPEFRRTLPTSDWHPGMLRSHVRGALQPRSEIISIQVDAADPSQAVSLTNAWATAYAEFINHLYGSGNSSNTVQALEAQRDAAYAQHQSAQSALTALLRDDRVDELSRAINEKQDRLAVIYRPTASVSTSSNADATKVVNSFDDYRMLELRTINSLAQTLLRLDTLHARLQALANQAVAGSTDVAAISVAKTQLLSISDGLPNQVQFQLPVSVSSNLDVNLDELIASVDRARTQLQVEFQTKRAEFEAGRAAEIRNLEEELRPMRAQLEELTSTRHDLTLKRDVAWDTYSALARKIEERKVAEAASGHEVEIAAVATDANPTQSNLWQYRISGGVLGFAAATLLLVLRRTLQRGLSATRFRSPAASRLSAT